MNFLFSTFLHLTLKGNSDSQVIVVKSLGPTCNLHSESFLHLGN